MKGDRRYYIYALLDTRRPGKFKYGRYEFSHQPFYIGKGTGDRVNAHFRNAFNDSHHLSNKTKRGRIRKIIQETGENPGIVKLHSRLTQDSSYKREARIIRLIGRKCVGSGPLLNIAEGGEGGTGVKRGPTDSAVRKKISRTNKATRSRMSEDERTSQVTKWRQSLASRSKRKQKRVTKQCAASAKHFWDTCTEQEYEKICESRSAVIRNRYSTMTDDQRLRFELKRLAGIDARALNLSDLRRKSLRKLIAPYIDSLVVSDKAKMRKQVARKMACLVKRLPKAA